MATIIVAMNVRRVPTVMAMPGHGGETFFAQGVSFRKRRRSFAPGNSPEIQVLLVASVPCRRGVKGEMRSHDNETDQNPLWKVPRPISPVRSAPRLNADGLQRKSA